MLAKGDAEIAQGSWSAAQASLEVARKSAEKAVEISKPVYEKAELAVQSKARDEALARDASALRPPPRTTAFRPLPLSFQNTRATQFKLWVTRTTKAVPVNSSPFRKRGLNRCSRHW